MIAIRDARRTANAAVSLVSRERIRPGSNGDFSASLFDAGTKGYVIELFFQLTFSFIDGPAASFSRGDERWTEAQKSTFVEAWRREVVRAWSAPQAGTLSDGRTVAVEFAFLIAVDVCLSSHFDIRVEKIPPGDFRQSSVRRRSVGWDVLLDSEDLTPRLAGQLPAVHEFGHMLGLPDEYKKSSPDEADRLSVMHGGASVRRRHYAEVLRWAESKRAAASAPASSSPASPPSARQGRSR